MSYLYSKKITPRLSRANMKEDTASHHQEIYQKTMDTVNKKCNKKEMTMQNLCQLLIFGILIRLEHLKRKFKIR